MASEIQTWYRGPLVRPPARQLLWGKGPARERTVGITGIALQIERRAMYARHDVLAQPRNELFSAADEDISDLLLVALPVDAAGVQAGIRLELEGVLTWRRHFGLVERRDVEEKGGLFHVAAREIAHRSVDVVVRVYEI